jgi:hypothetical protein
MKQKPNYILIIVASLVVLAGIYWFFFTDSQEEPALTSVTTGSAAQARFLSLASELQPITFNTGIFEDPRFAALVDLTTPIAPESSGRIDPFAPVPGISAR